MNRLLLLLPSLLILTPARAEVADPAKDSYADPSGGRAGYAHAGETVNEVRLYDFYQRQADHFMAQSEVPELLPAFPGLDAGLHGHWQKHSQNKHNDGRWNDVNFGPVVAHVFRSGKFKSLKALCVDLGDLHAVFDTQTLSWRAIWTGGFVVFDPFRWGCARNASPDGEPWFLDEAVNGWAGASEGRFLGSYRHGAQVILSYEIGGTRVLEVASTSDANGHPVFHRTFEFPEGVRADGLKLRLGTKLAGAVHPKNGAAFERAGKGVLWLKLGPQEKGAIVSVALRPVGGERPAVNPPSTAPSSLIGGGPAHFPQRLTVKGELGSDSGPYVVDTIPVPFANPFKTVMQLTSLAFLPDGDALVAVLCGEVWKVSGLGGDLSKVTWKRYATGLNQPIGIHIDKDGIFVLDRGRITRLHDLNDDDEVDYYENYADDFGGYDRSHTHTFGLARTSDGAFHFVQREDILRTSASPKTALEASGVRNCMGIGLWQDRFYVAPQEGTWTPTSMILEVRPGEYYGHQGDDHPERDIAPPLCYVPRGLDCSTGGMVQVTSDKWGPLQDHFLGISYGYGSHYLILRDDSGLRAQGASVPLAGEFRAGAMRGAVHPQDGQLYVAGLDGWGDYALDDGCLHRVRHTGNPVRLPTGFRVHSNGIRIDFSCALDAKASVDVSNFFVHQWNYLYSGQYGSPEFSVKSPGTVGHDHLAIRSVRALDGGRSIFLEIPDLVPSMQMHIRMHLTADDGTKFKTDLFPSILQLGDRFEGEGLAPPVEGKLTVINLPIKRKKETAKDTVSGTPLKAARELVVEVLGGLQYKQKELRAKAGEPLALKLVNTDVMPHNLVLAAPGKTEEVGMTAFKMLNDPKAAEKHYIPDLSSVLAYTFVVPPGGTHVTHFRAPPQPGRYPYLCTFPGHWQAMQGVLVVE